MSRIRSIKPEFWASEQVMGVPPLARLAFIGLWTFCDDGGNHPASARTIKAEVFPSDDMSVGEVDSLVSVLVDAGLLMRYEFAGKGYLNVTGWQRHQRIDQPTYRYPLPDGSMPINPPRRRTHGERSANTNGTNVDRSPRERSGEEWRGEKTPQPGGMVKIGRGVPPAIPEDEDQPFGVSLP